VNTCFEVANYFLKRQEPEVGDLMTNLKLQKLVYYAQGFYLAMMDSPLFNEPIEAWEHGPVCVPLYHEYKNFGSNRNLNKTKTSRQKQTLVIKY
jgi:uncharacterized phage-associated protein